MEALSRSLQPYKALVGSAASYVTIAQFFSGVFLCRDIHRKGSTKGFSSVPFIGGIVVGILMLKYALLLQDPAMLQVNLAAIFLNILYIAFYHVYSENKIEDVYRPLSYGTGLIAVFLGYAAIESEANLEFRYGFLITILMLMLIGAPLKDVKEILEKKDASSIPFPMTFMGTIVTFLWLLYGIILMNSFMVVQNIIGLALCGLQLTLIFLYPNPQEKPKTQ